MKSKEKFVIGDTVISLREVNFIDNKKHLKGEKIKITKESLAYFNFHPDYYDKETK